MGPGIKRQLDRDLGFTCLVVLLVSKVELFGKALLSGLFLARSRASTGGDDLSFLYIFVIFGSVLLCLTDWRSKSLRFAFIFLLGVTKLGNYLSRFMATKSNAKKSTCYYDMFLRLEQCNFECIFVVIFSAAPKKKELKKETGLGLTYKKDENFGEWYSEVCSRA